MFTLLNPIALWIGAATFIPIIIHFIGKSQTRKLDFPSIALLKEKLVKSSRQQKLKNLLLLLFRTLFILCLLLALSNPLYQKGASSPHPQNTPSLFVIHNGVWSSLRDQNNTPLMEVQRNLHKTLDSLTRSNSPILYVIDNNKQHSVNHIHQRYGSYQNVIQDITARMEDSPGTYQKVFLPIFDWQEILEVENELLTLKTKFPEAKIIVMDFTSLKDQIPEFTEIVETPPETEPTLIVKARISQPDQLSPEARLKSFLQGTPLQEIFLGQKKSEAHQFFFQIPTQKIMKGSIQLMKQPGWPVAHYFSYLNPGKNKLLHVGSEFTTLPSLGKEMYSKSIEHIEELQGDSLLNNLQKYRVILLSNTAIPQDKAYNHLLNFVRQGGNLIITLGHRSNIPKLNRELLVPAKMGFLSTLEESTQGKKKNQTQWLNLHQESLKPSEDFLTKFQPQGYVKKQFVLSSSSKNTILLSNKTGPLLVRAKMGEGEIFLWTVDLDNPEATSLGISSFTPMLHQWVLNKNQDTQWKNQAIWSDSIFVFSEEITQGHSPSVRGPDNRVFPHEKKLGLYKIGPFDKLGHYTVYYGSDSLSLAVNLKPVPPTTRDKETLNSLHAKLPGLVVLPPHKAIMSRGGSYYKLWKLFLAFAIGFLLLELIVTRFMGKNSR